jgi:hypothetical protein
MSDSGELLRPRDFALLLLGSGDLAPRRRARDQQADRVGLDLKRRVLEALLARDPDPEDMEAALLFAVDELGPPTGPMLAMARLVLDEWRTAAATPEWVAHLLGEAVRPPASEEGRRGRGLPG